MAPDTTPLTVAEQVARWKDHAAPASEELMNAFQALRAQNDRSRRDARHARSEAEIAAVEADVASTAAACQRLLDATGAFRTCLPTPVPQLTDAQQRAADEFEAGARMGLDGTTRMDATLFNRGMDCLSVASRQLGRAAAIGELAEGKASTRGELGNPRVAVAIIGGFIAFIVLLVVIGVMAS